jgi:hypothetical protein
MKGEKIVSNEDLNWLYYGDETNQIISKLTNEENKLKNEIDSFVNLTDNTVTLALAVVVHNMYDKVNNKLFAKILKNDQIERLKILDKKYKLLEYYENINI